MPWGTATCLFRQCLQTVRLLARVERSLSSGGLVVLAARVLHPLLSDYARQAHVREGIHECLRRAQLLLRLGGMLAGEEGVGLENRQHVQGAALASALLKKDEELSTS